MKYPFILRMIKSSIGRKQLQAITGLLLAVFVIWHLAANLLLLKGEEWYNGLIDKVLYSFPYALYVIEIGLFTVFLIHIFIGLWLRYENWMNSRVRKYSITKWHGGRTVSSSTMLYTALVMFAYLIFHLLHFKFTDHSMGFYQLVTSAFRNTMYVGIYTFAFLALGLHMSHGIQSAFQTLGINHEKYNQFIRILSYIIAAILFAGFTFVAAYFYLGLDIKPDIENNLIEAITE